MVHISSFPSTLYVEGVYASGAVRDVELWFGYARMINEQEHAIHSNRVKLTVVQVDLDMDGVDDSEETHKGGFIVHNDNDSDQDGTADKNEGAVTISGEIDLEKITLNDVYPLALTGTVTLKAAAGGAKIKVWENSTRGTEVGLPATYSTSTPSELPEYLYVEGYDKSGGVRDITLALEYSVGGKTFDDRVKATVYDGDLIIHNGLKGVSGGQELSEADEEATGAVTLANYNDTDGDGITDDLDSDVSVSGANPPGRQEHDMMQLNLEEPQPMGTGFTGSVRALWIYGVRSIWKEGPAGKEQSKSNGQATLTQLLSSFGSDNNANGTDDFQWWLEGTYPTSSVREVKLAYECKPTGHANWHEMDRVAATVFWVSKTSRAPWRVRQTASGFPDNPEPGPGKDLPDLDKASVIDFIENLRKSSDGSRYGHGTCVNVGGSDTAFGGRILYEFEVDPAGAVDLDVVFDVTRQIKYRDYKVDNATGTVDPDGDEDFPWQQTPVKDNELPNDDTGSADEDNDPTNSLLYSWDAPRHGMSAGGKSFVVSRNTFYEWVRVKLNNVAFSAGEVLEGSRGSGKEDWHCVYYLKRDGSGEWVEDNISPSYNTPVFTGTGDGTIAVTLLANADTEGYTAEYDEPTKTWTLTADVGTGSDTDTQNPAPQGTKWTLTIGTEVQVEITQGATAFADGDKFEFSVFKSGASSTGYKKNETATGSFDVTDGP
jgi:hypothetical protein